MVVCKFWFIDWIPIPGFYNLWFCKLHSETRSKVKSYEIFAHRSILSFLDLIYLLRRNKFQNKIRVLDSKLSTIRVWSKNQEEHGDRLRKPHNHNPQTGNSFLGSVALVMLRNIDQTAKVSTFHPHHRYERNPRDDVDRLGDGVLVEFRGRHVAVTSALPLHPPTLWQAIERANNLTSGNATYNHPRRQRALQVLQNRGLTPPFHSLLLFSSLLISSLLFSALLYSSSAVRSFSHGRLVVEEFELL